MSKNEHVKVTKREKEWESIWKSAEGFRYHEKDVEKKGGKYLERARKIDKLL